MCTRRLSAWTASERRGIEPVAEAIDAAGRTRPSRRRRFPRRPTASARGVGDEVGDRHVGLVADGRNHRHRARGDRARDDLLVERPEILDRSAAASDDDDVDAGHARRWREIARAMSSAAPSPCTRAGRITDCAFAIAPAEHLDDVADRGAVERRDDADLARQRRQRPLARLVEQPFGLQPLLQLLEGELQRAEPLRLEVLADDLVLALRLVDRHAAARDDAQAVRRLELQVAQRRCGT